jgi:hypothetical protein
MLPWSPKLDLDQMLVPKYDDMDRSVARCGWLAHVVLEALDRRSPAQADPSENAFDFRLTAGGNRPTTRDVLHP